MFRVRIIADPFDLASYSEHATCDVVELLQQQFPTWPDTAHIYKEVIALENDVTPYSEKQIEALSQAEDDTLFYVVVYPGHIALWVIVLIVAVVALAATILFLTPKIPTINQDDQSANNSLGQRSNKARPNSRIEDNFGDIISIPTLLTMPLLVFDNNLEVEYCFMCVGRGAYAISDVKDGDTPIGQIAGAGVSFYDPFTSPNSGSPSLTIGTAIAQPLLNVVKMNDVNGQSLRAPNANSVSGQSDIRFVYPDRVERTGSRIDFTKFFAAGDDITVSGSSTDGTTGTKQTIASARFSSSGVIKFETLDPTTFLSAGVYLTIVNGTYAADDDAGGTVYVDLSGTYLVASINANSATLDSPQSTNSDWSLVDQYPGGTTDYRSITFTTPTATASMNLDGTYAALAVDAASITFANPSAVNAAWNNINVATGYGNASLSTDGEHWVGPFTIDFDELTQVIANVTAPQGMYATDSKGKTLGASASALMELTPLNDAGLPSGPAETFDVTVSGDGTDKKPKGVTLTADPTFTGTCKVRMRRTTPVDFNSKNTIVDEIIWRDGYATAPVPMSDFGDVTTLFSRTYATASATSAKERKLNCRAVRKVLMRNADNSFGPQLAPSRSAADILCHMALDPRIGGRTLKELAPAQIYETVDAVVTYFGIPDTGEFGATFDQDNISFEEMAQTVAQAVFCTAYRQGSVLYLFFEQQTDVTDAILLFNHRNKVPKSETRTVRFGSLNDYDGVELDYVAYSDGAKLTTYIPADQSAVKAKKLDITGIIDRRGDGAVPFLHASRAYNKILYQNTVSEFTALGEASQLVLTQRIEVADNTRPDVFDGEVRSVQGLVVELSQPFNPVDGVEYTIFFQLDNGTVETRTCTAGQDEMHCVLQTAPSRALVTDVNAWALTTYQIIGNDNARPTGFLVSEKGPFDKQTVTIQAINYDQRYYQADSTYRT